MKRKQSLGRSHCHSDMKGTFCCITKRTSHTSHPNHTIDAALKILHPLLLNRDLTKNSRRYLADHCLEEIDKRIKLLDQGKSLDHLNTLPQVRPQITAALVSTTTAPNTTTRSVMTTTPSTALALVPDDSPSLKDVFSIISVCGFLHVSFELFRPVVPHLIKFFSRMLLRPLVNILCILVPYFCISFSTEVLHPILSFDLIYWLYLITTWTLFRYVLDCEASAHLVMRHK